MFGLPGRFSAKHPWITLALWMLVAVGLKPLAPDWQKNAVDDDIRFLPAETPSVRGHALLEAAFPNDVSASKAILTFERADGGVLTPADFEAIDDAAMKLRYLRRTEPTITQVIGHRDGPAGGRLKSDDGKCLLMPIALSTPYLAGQTRATLDKVETELKKLPSTDLKWTITGQAGVGRDLANASMKSLEHTTLATVALVVVVLLAVYRSPFLAMVPLFTIGVAVWVSLQLLAILTLIPGVQLVQISQVFAIVILFGAGTDYCLFLISRHREELEHGMTPGEGLPRATNAVSGAIVGSAGTVICGLGMMGFAQFGKIRCAGPVIALALCVGLLAALTITPALLSIGKRTVFWPQRLRLISPERRDRQFWHRAARFVVAKPGPVFAAALALLIPLAVLGTRVRPAFKPTGDLTPAAQSVRGLDIIQQHFTAGETGPVTVLLASPSNWATPEGRELVNRLSSGFANLPNVAEVRSLAWPLGKPLNLDPTGDPESIAAKLQRQVANAARRQAEDFYAARTAAGEYVTRLDVIWKEDPFEPASIDGLELIETWVRDFLPAQGADFGAIRGECFGVTVHARDMSAVIFRDRLVVNSLVTAGVFLILLVIVRRFWLAGYLLATVLLSYFATLGATALFTTWLTGKPFGLIEWRVPFFLFTILVAIGEDYNILLVSRILQERRRFGIVEGVRRGLAATGGTITACGVIMAGTFGTLMLADLSTLKQIGFALAFGVMLDTLVVRPFLVPAFMLLVWKEPDPVAVRKRTWHEKYRPMEELMRRAG